MVHLLDDFQYIFYKKLSWALFLFQRIDETGYAHKCEEQAYEEHPVAFDGKSETGCK
mgnify:CR=1 FL=1